MEQVVFKIGEVATRLGLVDKNNNTLRSWTEEFGAFLSASANPSTGQPRRYTARDVQTLTAVRNYRTNHLSYEEIRERLRAGELDVADGVEDAGAERDEDVLSASHSLSSLMPIDAVLAPLAASIEEWRRLAEEYRTRLERREARIVLLEQRLDELYGRFSGTTLPLDQTRETASATMPLDENRETAVLAASFDPASAASGAGSSFLQTQEDAGVPVFLDPTRETSSVAAVLAASPGDDESVHTPANRTLTPSDSSDLVSRDQTVDRPRTAERGSAAATTSETDGQRNKVCPDPALFPLPTTVSPPRSGSGAETASFVGTQGMARRQTAEGENGARRARRGWWFGRGVHRA